MKYHKVKQSGNRIPLKMTCRWNWKYESLQQCSSLQDKDFENKPHHLRSRQNKPILDVDFNELKTSYSVYEIKSTHRRNPIPPHSNPIWKPSEQVHQLNSNSTRIDTSQNSSTHHNVGEFTLYWWRKTAKCSSLRRQYLSRGVCMLGLRHYVNNWTISTCYKFPGIMMPHVDVLRVGVRDRILCKLTSPFIMLGHGDARLFHVWQYKTPNLPQKQLLIADVSYSNVFFLRYRQRRKLLRPINQDTHQSPHISPSPDTDHLSAALLAKSASANPWNVNPGTLSPREVIASELVHFTFLKMPRAICQLMNSDGTQYLATARTAPDMSGLVWVANDMRDPTNSPNGNMIACFPALICSSFTPAPMSMFYAVLQHIPVPTLLRTSVSKSSWSPFQCFSFIVQSRIPTLVSKVLRRNHCVGLPTKSRLHVHLWW